MRREGNYILGTVNEISDFLAKKLLNGRFELNKAAKKEFPAVDFTTMGFEDETHLPKHTSLQEASKLITEGWFGIKRLSGTFDEDSLELLANYYGGGAGVYRAIPLGSRKSTIAGILAELLSEPVGLHGKFYGDEVFLVEILGETRMITKDMVVAGMANGKIVISDEDGEPAAHIGDYWFWIEDGFTKRVAPAYTKEEQVSLVLNVFNAMYEEDDEPSPEYLYYYYILLGR